MQFLPLTTTIPVMRLIHVTTLFALVVGGMEVIQPATAGGLAGLKAGIKLEPVSAYAFQRRQIGAGIPQIPPPCTSICNPIKDTLASGACRPSQCCLASFEISYFSCSLCVVATVNLTDYSIPQSNVDAIYDQCASIGIQLPVLTFPGQNPNRALSSVVQLPSSQTIPSVPPTLSNVQAQTIATASAVQLPSSQFTSLPSSPIVQTTVRTLISPTNTPNPTQTLSSGIRSVETSCFYPITSAMMLGTWLYFAAF